VEPVRGDGSYGGKPPHRKAAVDDVLLETMSLRIASQIGLPLMDSSSVQRRFLLSELGPRAAPNHESQPNAQGFLDTPCCHASGYESVITRLIRWMAPLVP
jgi:hypothetical protein